MLKTTIIYDNVNLFDDEGILYTLSIGYPNNKEIPEEYYKQLITKLRAISGGTEITLTFKPELRQMYNQITLTEMVKKTIQHTRVKTGEKLQCVIIGEFSKLGNYHLHGILKTNGRLSALIKRKLTHDYGRTEIAMIRNTESWIRYCLKDEAVFIQEVPEHYTHKKILFGEIIEIF